MCSICRAVEFKNNPNNQLALQVVFNGQQIEGDFTEEFTLVACYREGMQVALGVRADPLCSNHQNLLAMMGAIQKANQA